MQQHKTYGFTLVEIMIVVAIIAMLTAIAIPAFLQYRKDARDSMYMNELRLMRDAFLSFNMKYSRYPSNEVSGVMPPEMALYFEELSWSNATPIGGYYDWEGPPWSGAAISVRLPDRTRDELTEIDRRFDDGNVLTGKLRFMVPTKYTYVLQEPTGALGVAIAP